MVSVIHVLGNSSQPRISLSFLVASASVLEYQKNIHNQLSSFRGFAKVTYKTIVPHHVGMWVLRRSTVY
jgi:hypothetical protein